MEHNVSQSLPDDEIDLLEYWGILWKRKKMIVSLSLVLVLGTIVGTLFMDNIYEAQALITPVANSTSTSGSLSSLASQFGGIASMVGISLPGGSSTSEINALLNSNILREEIITNYNLLPVIFHDQWDADKKDWKELNIFKRAVNKVYAFIRSMLPSDPKKQYVFFGNPSIWDGIRALGDDGNIINITVDDKNSTITIAADMDDPDAAAKVVSYFLSELNDHMRNESRRVAVENRKYLEEQLKDAVDPTTRQKIYSLINQQLETALMSEVKENFSFKVLDPPKAPDKKKKPKRGLIVVMVFLFSIFIGVLIAFFQDYLQKNKARRQQTIKETTSQLELGTRP